MEAIAVIDLETLLGAHREEVLKDVSVVPKKHYVSYPHTPWSPTDRLLQALTGMTVYSFFFDNPDPKRKKRQTFQIYTVKALPNAGFSPTCSVARLPI
jgi:hypothetical protein